MRGITKEFVQEFRQRRMEEDWDFLEHRQWMRKEEARLKEENPGLHDYIIGILFGLGDRLDPLLGAFICERLCFHLLELLAIVGEHEQVEELEKLWQK